MKFENIQVDLMENKKCKERSEALAEKQHNESESAYISYKERKELPAKHFLDPKNKSFPIRPGHECTDLEASLHRLGTYKGGMSRDTLHSKIIRMMKSHNCPLPKADKPE